MPLLQLKWIYNKKKMMNKKPVITLASFLLTFCLFFVGCASSKAVSEDEILEEEEVVEEEIVEEDIIEEEDIDEGDVEIAWDVERPEVTVWPQEFTAWEATEGGNINAADEEDGPFRIKNRTFSFGLLHLNVGVSNDFITSFEILQDKMRVDLDKLANGLKLNFNAAISPVFFDFNIKNIWGIGLTTGLDVTGSLALSGEMLSFGEIIDSKSDLYGAAFLDAGIPFFFSIKKFKIKAKPSVYYPLAVVIPDISYTYINQEAAGGGRETIIKIDYTLDVFTPFPLNFDQGFMLTALPGADIYLGTEFPLSDMLNLQSIHFALDFDLGLDLFGIPIMASTLNDYTRYEGRIGSDDPIDLMGTFMGGGSMDDLLENFTPTFDATSGIKRKTVFRPFKMLLWANWRPFEDKKVSFIPAFGFSINTLYDKTNQFSLEGGLKARLDLANLFIVTLNVGYYDRFWKNNLELTLNFKAFQFDLILGMQSADFVKSWSGAGFGVGLGFTFGW
jgi:hypothetical protein